MPIERCRVDTLLTLSHQLTQDSCILQRELSHLSSHLCFVKPATFVDQAVSGSCSKERPVANHIHFTWLQASLCYHLTPQISYLILQFPVRYNFPTTQFHSPYWILFGMSSTSIYVVTGSITVLLFHALNSQISFKREKNAHLWHLPNF